MRGLARAIKPQIARRTSQAQDIPAPVGGLNTRDSFATMPATDAIELTNYIVESYGVVSRNGYEDFANSLADDVKSLIPYLEGSAQFFISASGGELEKVTTGGVVSSLGSGFSSDLWETVKLGINMVFVNGVDDPRNFDGTNLTTPVFTGDLSTYGPENIDNIHKHRNRVYMWDTDDNKFFYGGTNAVAGSFAEFPLSRVSDTGGNLVEMKTISQDAGNGPDDYAAFILDTGEVIIYAGSDPGDATNWTLVGKYKMPPIIGKRCAVEFAGDVLILTKIDLVKLSDVIKFTGETGGFNVNPSKLSGAIRDSYNAYQNEGFSITLYPKGGLILINIPITSYASYVQYVINTTTSGASKFSGWNANVFAVLGDNLYFGISDTIVKADSGLDDNGVAIELFARQAFTNLNIATKKKVSNVRLYMAADGALNIDLALGYDFSFPNPQGTQTSSVSGSEWDVAPWDVSSWAGTVTRLISFVTGGLGIFVGLQTRILISGQKVNWYATTYNFDISKIY